MRSAEQIRSFLRPYNIKRVSEEIGIHMNVVYAFMNEKSDPRYSTIEKLNAYIDRKESEANDSAN